MHFLLLHFHKCNNAHYVFTKDQYYDVNSILLALQLFIKYLLLMVALIFIHFC